jgi:signal transduction histidine kinase
MGPAPRDHDSAAVADKNGRIDRTRQLRVFYRISRLASTSLPPETVGGRGLRELCLALAFERAEIWLFGSNRAKMRLLSAFGEQQYAVHLKRVNVRDCAFTMEVLRRRQAIHHPNVTESLSPPEKWRPWTPVTSVFGSPLRARGRLIGVLCADRGGRRFVMPASELLVGSILSDLLAEVIASAIEREARARRHRQMVLISKVGHVISVEERLPSLARRLTTLVQRQAGCNGVLLALYDEKRRELETIAAAGVDAARVVGRRTRPRRVARTLPGGTAFLTRRPVLVEDLRERPDLTPCWPGTRSVLAVPIQHRDRALGALRLEFTAPFAVDEEDIEIFTLLGVQIGHAIRRALVVKDLHRRQADLSAVSADLDRALEEDRRRIARELHDELAQSMTAAKINLGLLKDMTVDALPAVRQTIRETGALIDRTIAETRRISMDLRPSMLDELGLVPTLRWYAHNFSQRTGIRVALEARDGGRRLGRELETLLYRFVQEGLTNVARHAKARRVRVGLRSTNGLLRASVSDDGCGISANGRRRAGLGLLGMRERIERAAGRFRIESGQGRGTRLTAEIPLRGRAAPRSRAAVPYVQTGGLA